MEKDILKQWLLEKRPGAYATIIKVYKDKALNNKPSLFINWLSKHFDLPESDISESAVNSAIKRQRKKEKDQLEKPKKNANNSNDFDTDIPEKLGFK